MEIRRDFARLLAFDRWANGETLASLGLLFHSAYHRGQVASLVRAAGGTPAVTDYIAAARRGITG